MQNYTDIVLQKINEEYSKVHVKYVTLTNKIFLFSSNIQNERAKEFLQNGVSRRLWLLYRCIENIFDLFPPTRIRRLVQNNRLDVEINLHTFLINTYGIIENTALAIAYENNLVGNKAEGKFNPIKINLFSEKFQKKLNRQLCDYLSNDTTKHWYKKYAKNYRDALAHRIPPYVPPAVLNNKEQLIFKKLHQEIYRMQQKGDFIRASELQNKQESLGRANPLFIHSFSEEAVKPFYLHLQIITDFVTIEELLNIVITTFYSESEAEK